ncbi:acetyl-CoA acetyltransferase [Prescottella equi]|jgi:acetyl-CoA C-acetyltransferase|uniref:steroid 3-ketoacyl-CoA thiolase n=1 Tax=Rhodococcus TaxID=1827 RepID=UPI00064203EA|nr:MULTISPECIES: steroid 3-ketoacyl-CoA thiolase [Rhodococcus]KLN68932.1 acetyl-CoA acetyltransferase [Rhodococcus erythropolis]OCC21372.1 acetyl-CoA acetyltransferase [Prescottella equi]MBT2272137.1 steroid 3-ketoacyl-CoA thiolase [Rhodococcus qingshengii]MBW4817420.1 steroid 3-ketoacyl-CoA thiolase [Rhodococcus qingshengii]MCZ4615277.1 steroid 3-ketoacyl-CoA thiolase [Rhodococcus qingshengii]
MKPVIVDAARTPFGKREGWLSGVHAAELLGYAQKGVLDRVGVDPGAVDQVIGGCVTPLGEQFGNIVRTSWMHAGLPLKAGCTTIDAQCGTAQQSVQLIAGQIAIGAVDVGVACGVELMSRAPLTYKVGTGLGTPRPESWSLDTVDQYTAADRIAVKRGFSREDLDSFGLRSQQRAAAAWEAGRFDSHIIDVVAPGSDAPVHRDQGLRESSLEGLAKLRTVQEGGLHTAGTSSQVSDGASAALLMSEDRARMLGVRPRAKILAQCVIGGDIEFMLDGPVDAANIVLGRTGLTIDDIDLFEVNEAFASVPMSFAQVHGVDPELLNVNGGAIALGHPAGATGIRLLANVIDELERRDKSIALIAICASAATTCLILERI